MKRTNYVLLILAITLLVNVGCKKTKVEWKPNPPFAGLEVPFNTFEINTMKDTLLSLPNGTTIFIPSNCFTNLRGKPVSDNVTLLYREFHDAVDIFLSGIHMEFTSMGEKRYLSTAGMFEIDARKGEEKLLIGNGKKIDVKFASKYGGTNYSFFYLNPETGAWEWVDLPETEVNTEKVEAVAALNAKKPLLPLGDTYFVFDSKFLLDIYPALISETIRQQLDVNTLKEKLKEYKIKMYDIPAYDEVRFGNSYYHPAELLWKDLDGKVFPKWLKNFKGEWKMNSKGEWIKNYNFEHISGNTYEIFYSQNGKVFKKRMEAIIPVKNLLRLPANEWQNRYDEAMEQLMEEQKHIDIMAETFRAISLNSLGIYNYDCLAERNGWFDINPIFVLNKTKNVKSSVIFILGDNRSYIEFMPDDFDIMKINPETNHRIFMILPNNKIAIYPVEKFDKVDIDSLRALSKPTYLFELESKKINNASELRAVLGFKFYK